jgi:hypothetical protein
MEINENLWVARLKDGHELAPSIFDKADYFKITFRKPN